MFPPLQLGNELLARSPSATHLLLLLILLLSIRGTADRRCLTVILKLEVAAIRRWILYVLALLHYAGLL